MSQCWSYSPSGDRCVLHADHHYAGINPEDDRHCFEVRWTDEEAWTPGTIPNLAPPPVVTVTNNQEPATTSGVTCMMCEHPAHPYEECVLMVRGEQGKFACGCMTSVPSA